MPMNTVIVAPDTKIWSSALKDGGNSNMAVDGSATPKIYSLEATSNNDYEVHSLCVIAEFVGSPAIGDKFLSSAIDVLANGLLLEAKINDTEYVFGNIKRTREMLEMSHPQGGFNAILGNTSLLQVFMYIPPRTVMKKIGTFDNDDYIKATVRDNLVSINYMEIFGQGVEL